MPTTTLIVTTAQKLDQPWVWSVRKGWHTNVPPRPLATTFPLKRNNNLWPFWFVNLNRTIYNFLSYSSHHLAPSMFLQCVYKEKKYYVMVIFNVSFSLQFKNIFKLRAWRDWVLQYYKYHPRNDVYMAKWCKKMVNYFYIFMLNKLVFLSNLRLSP